MKLGAPLTFLGESSLESRQGGWAVEFKIGEWGPAPAQERSKNPSMDTVSVRAYIPDHPPSEELSFMRPLSVYVEEPPAPPIPAEKPDLLVAPPALALPEPPLYASVLKDPVSSQELTPFPPAASTESEKTEIAVRQPAAGIDSSTSKAPRYPAENDAPKRKSTGYPGSGEPYRSKTQGYLAESDLPKGKASGFSRVPRTFSSKTLELAAEIDLPKGKGLDYAAGSDAIRGNFSEPIAEVEVPEQTQAPLSAGLEPSETKLGMFSAYSGFEVEELLKVVIDPDAAESGSPNRKSLTIAETDRLARVARTYEVAFKVFGNSESARKWMTGKKHRFDGKTALSLLQTEAGESAVRQFLVQIDEGMFV